MRSASPLSSPLRLTKPAALRGASLARHASTTRQNRRTTEDDSGDFRPAWVYAGSRLLTYTTIPLALLYCTFLADWGEREHIFMPLRRWVSKYKQSVLSLTPEEAALAQRNNGRAPSSSLSLPEKSS